MPRRILIRLPWPPSKTSSNGSQGDFYGKARAAASYKEHCAKACIEQAVRRISGVRRVVINYHPPRNGKLDWDNISNRAKQGFDAVAEAIGVDDSKWWPVLLDKGEKVKNGCILIEFEEGK